MITEISITDLVEDTWILCSWYDVISKKFYVLDNTWLHFVDVNSLVENVDSTYGQSRQCEVVMKVAA
jgi:hypothetical protein